MIDLLFYKPEYKFIKHFIKKMFWMG